MPTFKLNGNDIPFEPGDTIIQAAWRQAQEIPHYCWHPGLSIAANCRMCLVEIKSQKPMQLPIVKWDEQKQAYVDDVKTKMVPACQTPAAENMDVVSNSDLVKQAQASVQEFLLLNHPVDCPICDQAGECKLQDYWLDHQHELKRKETEPVHKPKAVRFGPTIVYDAERCIMCTRCIRFCDEVVGDHVLDMRERGNKNEIVLSPGRELNHDYTLMTEHVCPVGALTSKDFRFKARVWFLRSTPSVCNGCATGCNSFIDYDPRTNRAERLRPRDNHEVNKFWMCDDGMMTYKDIHDGRVITAASRMGGVPRELSLEQGIAEAAKALEAHRGAKVAVVLSAQHSNEDNFALASFAKQVLGTDKFYLAAKGGWKADNILRNADNNPNRAGATLVALRSQPLPDTQQLLSDVGAGEVDVVVVLGSAAAQNEQELAALAKAKLVISLTSHAGVWTNAAQIIVPVSAHGEVDGTFVNAKGIHQRFKRAFASPAGVKSAWETIVAIASKMSANAATAVGYRNLNELRKALPSSASSGKSIPPAASANL